MPIEILKQFKKTGTLQDSKKYNLTNHLCGLLFLCRSPRVAASTESGSNTHRRGSCSHTPPTEPATSAQSRSVASSQSNTNQSCRPSQVTESITDADPPAVVVRSRNRTQREQSKRSPHSNRQPSERSTHSCWEPCKHSPDRQQQRTKRSTHGHREPIRSWSAGIINCTQCSDHSKEHITLEIILFLQQDSLACYQMLRIIITARAASRVFPISNNGQHMLIFARNFFKRS